MCVIVCVCTRMRANVRVIVCMHAFVCVRACVFAQGARMCACVCECDRTSIPPCPCLVNPHTLTHTFTRTHEHMHTYTHPLLHNHPYLYMHTHNSILLLSPPLKLHLLHTHTPHPRVCVTHTAPVDRFTPERPIEQVSIHPLSPHPKKYTHTQHVQVKATTILQQQHMRVVVLVHHHHRVHRPLHAFSLVPLR